MAIAHGLYALLLSKASPSRPLVSSVTAEIILILLLLYILAPLSQRLLAHLSSRQLTGGRGKETRRHDDLTRLPSLLPRIPWIGHVIGLQNNSARYVNRLLASTSAPIFTIDIPFKRIIVAQPRMERLLSRHHNDTGLAQILGLVGPRVFDLGKRTIELVLDSEPRPLHNVEFGGAHSKRVLSERSGTYIWEQMAAMPSQSEVDLGYWMFGMTVAATASAVWGVENPWRMDREFADEFMNLSESFDSLSRPLPWLTASAAYKSRQFLSKRLQAFHATHRESRVQTVAHSVNIVAQNDADWETNPDYFNIEMVSALGLLATPSTLCVWLVRHLLAQPALAQVIADEVTKLDDVAGEESGLPMLDVSQARTRCPWLVAAWYETLRLHMTGVPRIARHDFSLAVPELSEPLAVSQGDVFLLPMCAANRDVAAWGSNAADFAPERFITGSGDFAGAAARKVKAFGVAGNLCPGREFGFEVAMAVVGGVLRNFNMRSSEADRDICVPGVRRGFNVGFERYADDVKVVLERR